MIVVNDTAVRADGNINTCFLIVFVTCSSNLNNSACLSASDTLCFSGDTDRAAADTDFNKVSASLCKEAEAVTVNYVTCANLYRIAISLTNKVNGLLLPDCKALRGIDTENISARINKRGNTLLIVTGVYTRSNNISLVCIKKLLGIFLMLSVVLTEYEILKITVLVNYRKRIELIVPDNIVSFLKSCALGCLPPL